jgi:hypothetical protein
MRDDIRSVQPNQLDEGIVDTLVSAGTTGPGQADT